MPLHCNLVSVGSCCVCSIRLTYIDYEYFLAVALSLYSTSPLNGSLNVKPYTVRVFVSGLQFSIHKPAWSSMKSHQMQLETPSAWKCVPAQTILHHGLLLLSGNVAEITNLLLSHHNHSYGGTMHAPPPVAQLLPLGSSPRWRMGL